MEILGKQILLRDWELEDLASYKQWMVGNPVWKTMDAPYYPLASEAKLNAGLAHRKQIITEKLFHEPRNGFVVARMDNRALVGVVNWYWESEETSWMSNGIAIFDPAFWGKGIGYEALGLWNQYLLDEFEEVVRLDLRTWSGNIGMMRLAEKLGYQLEARFRKARVVDGKYYDSIGYGVLREEWNALYPVGFQRFLYEEK